MKLRALMPAFRSASTITEFSCSFLVPPEEATSSSKRRWCAQRSVRYCGWEFVPGIFCLDHSNQEASALVTYFPDECFLWPSEM